MLELKERDEKGVIIIDIKGRFTAVESPEFKAYINKLLEKGKKRIIVNLGGVSFIDSSGIGALVGALTTLRKQEGNLKILNLNDQIEKIFQITRLNKFFDIYEDEFEAVESF